MGTHPIFESDFDCLTEMENEENFRQENEKSRKSRPIAKDRRDARRVRQSRVQTRRRAARSLHSPNSILPRSLPKDLLPERPTIQHRHQRVFVSANHKVRLPSDWLIEASVRHWPTVPMACIESGMYRMRHASNAAC